MARKMKLTRLEEASNMEREVDPPGKIFKKKCVNIDTLESYEEEKLKLNLDWWGQWIKNPLGPEYVGPKLIADEVRKVSEEVGYRWISKVEEICKIMEQGADLGIEGEGRMSTRGVNTESAILDGEKLVDSLQSSILLGHIIGPLDWEEVEELGDVKIIPIDTRPKPNGACRIIINMSHPHTKIWDEEKQAMREAELGDGVPLSPNMGNKHWTDFEECSMSSDRDFRMALYECGHDSCMCKSDWAYAYKHIPVCRKDWGMQVLQLGGKLFIETALTFGGSNSPSIFRMVASFLKEVTELKTGFDPRMNIMVLDDLCSVGRKEDGKVKEFFEVYRSYAKRMGVELASLDDPGKAFAPCKQGEILGIEYDTQSWTWRMPQDKGQRLLALMWKVLEMKGATAKDFLTMMGRITHYKNLACGTYQRGFLYVHLREVDCTSRQVPDAWISLDLFACCQLWWWIINLRVVQKYGAALLDPRDHLAAAALVLHSDAAGGNSSRWKGWGGFCEEKKEYVLNKWPAFILKNKLYKESKWGSKLTLLEGYAAFMTLMTWLPEARRRGSVTLRVDNTGFCYAYKKGHSRDLYVYTLVKALRYVAESLELNLHVLHVMRRTDDGDMIVDHLSKNEVEKAKDLCSAMIEVPVGSKYLEKWIRQPAVLWDLGRRMLIDGGRWSSLVDRDYMKEMREFAGKFQWRKEEKKRKEGQS